MIAACFGLFVGIAEGLYNWLASVLPDHLGWKNDLLPEILWIPPLFDLLLFLALAIPVVIVSRFLPRVRLDLCVYVVFGWLSVFGILSASGRLHRVTCVLLASGVVVTLYRYASPRRALSTPSLVRIFAGLTLVVLLMNLSRTATNLGKAESTPPPQNRLVSPDTPNVLLITLDTLRADHVSSYGYARQTTPNLDKLASEGVLFENAFATASWTLPSHASMMTGRYTYEHRAGGSPLNKQFPTLAEALSSLGYATAGFIANNEYCSAKTGLSRGFSTYEDHFSNVPDMIRQTYYGKLIMSGLPFIGYYDLPGRKNASEVNREFFNWLGTNRGTPFFAFLNYFDVHDPYIAPASYQRKFAAQPTKGNLVNSLLFPRDFTGGRRLSDQEVQAYKDAYDECLAYLDNQLGLLLDRLKVLGLLDKTLIIVTSDHGESFGDHSFYGHGNNVYRNLIHVPLIIRYPSKVPTKFRVSEAVGLQAIPASVLNLVGFDSQSTFPGTSISHFWSQGLGNSREAKSLAFAESLKGIVHNPAYPLGRRGITKSLTSSKWNLILHEEGDIELFEVDRDPEELYNQANTSEGKAVIKELGPQLKSLMPSEDWKAFCQLVDSCDSH
jgi:arylsulfatase A-like enzyme